MSTRHVGVTGTRRGLSELQHEKAHGILYHMSRALGYRFLHHGDCVGADLELDKMAKLMSLKTICHPPVNNRYRANTVGHALVMPCRPYLERNHDIVAEVEVMLAFPGEQQEVLRSGTWATIRWAASKAVTCMIVFPDGSIRVEDNK
jgi:hypothetical protein